MKKSILNFILCAILTITSFSAAQAQYRYANNNTTTSSFESEVKALEDIIELAGFNIVSYDIVTLKKGEFFNWDLSCVKGRTYKVYTYVENGVNDINLSVYDTDDNFIEGAKPIGLANTFLTEFDANISTNALLQAANLETSREYKKYKVAIIVAYQSSKNTYLKSKK